MITLLTADATATTLPAGIKALLANNDTKFGVSLCRQKNILNGYGQSEDYLCELSILTRICRKCGAPESVGISINRECLGNHSWLPVEPLLVARGVGKTALDAVSDCEESAQEFLQTHQPIGAIGELHPKAQLFRLRKYVRSSPALARNRRQSREQPALTNRGSETV